MVLLFRRHLDAALIFLAAAGARVTAVDVSAPRLRRLADNLQRLRLSAECVRADATEWRPSEPADAVLLDAPCSATGTLRRHPDIARLKRPCSYEFINALPKNNNGKVTKTGLRKWASLG